MHETEGLAVLNDAQAIEAVALGVLKEFLAEKIVGTAGGDDDGLGAVRQPALVVLEIQEAEQIAADRRGREQSGGEIDIEIIGLAERHVELGVGCAAPGQSRRHLARGNPPPHHGALGNKLVPRHELETFDIEGRNA